MGRGALLLIEYDRLCNAILESMKKFEEVNATPEVIYLSPEAFKVLKNGYKQYGEVHRYDINSKPTCFGMEIKVRDLPEDFWFCMVKEANGGQC